MSSSTSRAEPAVDDAELVRRIARHDEVAFAFLMRRHNAGLFRVARAILKDDADAEDALQEAYLAAFRHIAEFRAESKLSTWLTRILINQALAQRHSRARARIVVQFGDRRVGDGSQDEGDTHEAAKSPEQQAARAEFRRILERTLDEVPAALRTVFALRELADLTVEETAACLSIPKATVRSRLFRARGILRESLTRELDLATDDIFTFYGERCDRIVARVLARWRTAVAGAPGGPPPESP